MSISFAPSCIMRCASAGVTDVIVIGSVLLAVELIERGEQHLGPGVSDPVPERLALATEGYEPLVTHLRQMLRQGRLREADVIGEIADRALAMFDELAQHHQAPVIARSEEHTSEPQSLMRISYAVFCLKKNNNRQHRHKTKKT